MPNRSFQEADHQDEDYAFALPSLIAHKQCKLELRAGAPPGRGRNGTAARYSLVAFRAAERDLAAQSEGRLPYCGRRLAAASRDRVSSADVTPRDGNSPRLAVAALPDSLQPGTKLEATITGYEEWFPDGFGAGSGRSGAGY